jgi:hypothetical protein
VSREAEAPITEGKSLLALANFFMKNWQALKGGLAPQMTT